MSVSIDIKYAVRLLLKKPAFTALTVLIVAVGLGLTLYTFSLLNNLVFKPLMLNGKSQIVAIEAQYDSNHLSRRTADVFHLQRAFKELDMLQSIGFYAEGTTLIGGANSGTNTSAKMYNTTYSSWNVFEFTGVQPILGRGFKPEDLHEGAEPVVVLSYKVWHDYFNGDESIVGTMAPLDAIPTRIIGIMPEDFAFPVIAEIWQPLQQAQVEPTEQTRRGGLFSFSRLKEGVTLAQLQQRLDILSDEIIPELPDNQKWRIGDNGKYLNVLPFKKAAIVQYYTIFMAMLVVTMLILLLACINVGNLLLARVNERFKEIAIRCPWCTEKAFNIANVIGKYIYLLCWWFLSYFISDVGLRSQQHGIRSNLCH